MFEALDAPAPVEVHMKSYTLPHLADSSLLDELREGFAGERRSTVWLLVRIAEVEARGLYLPAGYDSMLAFCVGEYQQTEDVALVRIRVARAARKCPALFDALADGRLHLTAALKLAPHITPELADELIEASAHKILSEVARWLAARFPEKTSGGGAQVGSKPVATGPEAVAPSEAGPSLVLKPVEVFSEEPAVTVPETTRMEISIGKATQDKLDYARSLLSHILAPRDVPAIFDRALDALIVQVEKRRFGAGSGRRNGKGRSANPRHIPVHVKAAVWKRDGGCCAFVSEGGKRCGSRDRVEFHHIVDFAKGGDSSIGNIGLLCRAHNQFMAERSFGTEFMRRKREEGVARAAEESERAAGSGTSLAPVPGPEPELTRVAASAPALAPEPAPTKPTASEGPSLAERLASARARAAAAGESSVLEDGVFKAMCSLGHTSEEARTAARFCEDIADAPLGEQVKVALQYFHPKRGSAVSEIRAWHGRAEQRSQTSVSVGP